MGETALARLSSQELGDAGGDGQARVRQAARQLRHDRRREGRVQRRVSIRGRWRLSFSVDGEIQLYASGRAFDISRNQDAGKG